MNISKTVWFELDCFVMVRFNSFVVRFGLSFNFKPNRNGLSLMLSNWTESLPIVTYIAIFSYTRIIPYIILPSIDPLSLSSRCLTLILIIVIIFNLILIIAKIVITRLTMLNYHDSQHTPLTWCLPSLSLLHSPLSQSWFIVNV